MEEKKARDGKDVKYLGKEIFFEEEKKNGEGKGGKYLEKENVFFCGGEEKWRRKSRKIFGEKKYFLWRRRRTEKEI